MRWTMEWAICGSTELDADSEEDARRQFAEFHILDIALGGELDAHTCYPNEPVKQDKTRAKIVNEALDEISKV